VLRLEKALRSFSVVTRGEVVCFKYLDKVYYMDILDTKPASAVSIIETNMDVDFAPPADYVPPTAPATAAAAPATAAAGAGDSAGLTFGTPDGAAASAAAAVGGGAAEGAGGDGSGDGDETEDGPKFVPFSGTGYRLDGKHDGADGGSAGAGAGAGAGGLSAVQQAMMAARNRRKAPSQGRVVSTPTRPSSAARRRSMNRFEAARQQKAFQGTGRSIG